LTTLLGRSLLCRDCFMFTFPARSPPCAFRDKPGRGQIAFFTGLNFGPFPLLRPGVFLGHHFSKGNSGACAVVPSTVLFGICLVLNRPLHRLPWHVFLAPFLACSFRFSRTDRKKRFVGNSDSSPVPAVIFSLTLFSSFPFPPSPRVDGFPRRFF